MKDLTGRQPATQHLQRTFGWEHLPPHLQEISRPCAELADRMIEALPDGDELSAGLRKLREAKDCFVSAEVYKDPVVARNPIDATTVDR